MSERAETEVRRVLRDHNAAEQKCVTNKLSGSNYGIAAAELHIKNTNYSLPAGSTVWLPSFELFCSTCFGLFCSVNWERKLLLVFFYVCFWFFKSCAGC